MKLIKSHRVQIFCALRLSLLHFLKVNLWIVKLMLHHYLLIINEIFCTTFLFQLTSVAISYASIRCVPRPVLIALVRCDTCLLISIRSLPLLWWISFPWIILLLNSKRLLNLAEIGICFINLITSSISTSVWVTFVCIVNWSLTHLWLLHFDLLLNFLDLVDLMFAVVFYLSVWLLWLISHRRLTALLILTSV